MVSFFLFFLSIILYFVSNGFGIAPVITIILWTVLSLLGVIFALTNKNFFLRILGCVLNGIMLLFSILLLIAAFIIN